MGETLEKIGKLAEEVAAAMGVEVVDVELLGQGRRTLLRITIDRVGGVKLDECETFSRDIGALLDVEDTIRQSYTLEVSSVGLDRPLKNRRDFERRRGELAKVELKDKVEGKATWTGIIGESGDESVRLDCDGIGVDVPYEKILKARLEIKIK